jgi:hypothetical protein
MPYVDAVQVARTYLAGVFTAARVLTELPADLGDVLPVIRVSRIGGNKIEYVLDFANLDIDIYDDPKTIHEQAEQVRKSLLVDAEGQQAAGGFIAGVEEISGPKVVPYDNTALRRISTTFRIAIRSTP